MEIFNFNNETVMMYLITATPLYISSIITFIFIKQIKKDEIKYQNMNKNQKPLDAEAYLLMILLCFFMSLMASFPVCVFLAYFLC